MADVIPKIKVTDPPRRAAVSPFEKQDAGYAVSIEGVLHRQQFTYRIKVHRKYCQC